MKEDHSKRIHTELRVVGMTGYGFTKLATKELPKITHNDEHIGGVVYGKIGGGVSALLIATDKRVLFIDKRTLFMTTDELTYDVVSGVKSSKAGPFVTIVLHTRVSDYTIRYANPTCARIFIAFIEKKCLEVGNYSNTPNLSGAQTDNNRKETTFEKAALELLHNNDLAVLSTVDRSGNVSGAYVYYTVDEEHKIYILTKAETEKGRNIHFHNQVSLMILKENSMKTLQLSGITEIETREEVKHSVYEHIVSSKVVDIKGSLPPVTKINAGAFIVLRIHPLRMKYHDYAS